MLWRSVLPKLKMYPESWHCCDKSAASITKADRIFSAAMHKNMALPK